MKSPPSPGGGWKGDGRGAGGEGSRSRLAAAMLPSLLALLLPAALFAEVLSVESYRQRLAGIDGRLRSGDWVGARTEAGKLSRDRIAFGEERLEPDPSLLGPLAVAKNAEAARSAAPRLAQLIAALPSGAAASAPFARTDVLERVRQREAVSGLPRGGSLHRKDIGLLDALAELLDPARRWLRGLWERILEWLRDLLSRNREKKDGAFNLPIVVTVLVVALALAALWIAWRLLSRRKRRQEAAVGEDLPPPSAADEDPLSREAGEWERYALELAAAGRAREAIRAWYHAVLVVLFQAGQLHYRKGRTNWEYVLALAPGHAWRARFIEMTHLFEREWYGRDRSTTEALQESEDLARSLVAVIREAA